MKFELKAFTQKHMAIDLKQSGDVLIWDSFGNTHTLMIRAKYGEKITIDRPTAKELSNIPDSELLQGHAIKLSGNRYATLIKQSSLESYTVSFAPASYAVFCCAIDRDDKNRRTCVVYIPNDACEYRCDIKYEVTPRTIRDEPEEKTGWLNKLRALLSQQEPAVPQFILYIPVIPGYEDSGLHYTFNSFGDENLKFQYPITKKMLGRRIIIQSPDGNAPIVEAEPDSGYTVK